MSGGTYYIVKIDIGKHPIPNLDIKFLLNWDFLIFKLLSFYKSLALLFEYFKFCHLMYFMKCMYVHRDTTSANWIDNLSRMYKKVKTESKFNLLFSSLVHSTT